MTDRELLELAAKAAGVDWIPASSDVGKQGELKFGLWLNIQHEPTEATRRRFNPLNDDGDAFRLAVKLRIDIDHGSPLDNSRYVCASCCGIEMVRDAVRAVEEFEDDVGVQRAYATRRAIVRAAAELAKQEKP